MDRGDSEIMASLNKVGPYHVYFLINGEEVNLGNCLLDNYTNSLLYCGCAIHPMAYMFLFKELYGIYKNSSISNNSDLEKSLQDLTIQPKLEPPTNELVEPINIEQNESLL